MSNHIIDTLREWQKDPAQLEDDEFITPTKEIIELALSYAQSLHDEANAVFTQVAPNGDGGICFEWNSGAKHEVVEIYDDGTAELIRFEGSRLVEKRAIEVHATSRAK